MNESQISVRYAKALFKAALNQELEDRVYEDMILVLEASSIEAFAFLLEIPTMGSSRKSSIVREVLKGKVSGLTFSLVDLVMENRRERFLPGIARHYQALYKTHKGIVSVSLTTAVKMNEATSQKIENRLKKTLRAEIEMLDFVDPSLIGGFILNIGDHQYDASVATGLKRIKERLLDTSVTKL
ncbi:MAG: ATP synthase F1 subunit delta [Bacteroidales bacterium]|nr:ATP synthase F1 subunit delta [Bacteroidales bacterium]MBN2699780.1 ATP synthase F1 subunit delta [Bacteroidales bacterium]